MIRTTSEHMANPRVFTIPAATPFVPTLVRALIDGALGFATMRDPLALAGATLYLPTRRACRLVRDQFLDIAGGRAAILPRIVPLGDIDEDEIAFAQAAMPEESVLDLPPAIDGLERRLLLAELVTRWAHSPAGHKLCEQQAPLEPVDRRRQVEHGLLGHRGLRERDLVFVDVAERHDTRQDRGTAACDVEELVAHQAAGAPGWQVEGR